MHGCRSSLVVSLVAWSRIKSGTTTDLWFNTEAHTFDTASGDNLTQYAARPNNAPPNVGMGCPAQRDVQPAFMGSLADRDWPGAYGCDERWAKS